MDSTSPIFSTRPVVYLDLPLAPNTEILHPEQVMAKIGAHYHDLGAFCYSVRSSQKRKMGQPRQVVLSSFLPQRPKQILQHIQWLSAALADCGNRAWTVKGRATYAKLFMDWADTMGYHDCLEGGAATRSAFRAWVAQIEHRHRTHELTSVNAARLQSAVCSLLEAITNSSDLARGVRFVRKGSSPNGGTQPVPDQDFAHSLALSQCLLDGLTELLLEVRPFPFKLDMPKSLGWNECHLWVFPAQRWQMPPQLHGQTREGVPKPFWLFNYAEGRIATEDELWPRYKQDQRGIPGQRWDARRSIARASTSLHSASQNVHHPERIKLAMIAHNAFVFLFLANTGCNISVAQQIETDGTIDVSTLNQRYRAIKYRAQGKEISVVCPAAFMPSMRRFMELRKYLLNGRDYPYLFVSLGKKHLDRPNRSPKQLADQVLSVHYATLSRIDFDLPKITPRQIRATVEDYYRRKVDSTVAARVMGHSEAVAERNYLAGSPEHHHDELSVFLNKVAASAKSQKVIAAGAANTASKRLEEGGTCDEFGYPEAMAADLPLPDCRQGCLFCYKRVLVANEDDARKIASAAFVMEQLILGPLSEDQFRPQIQKCDDDLEKIAKFDGCGDMVKRIRRDVFENGNLTPYFENKYQLFLDLGVL